MLEKLRGLFGRSPNKVTVHPRSSGGWGVVWKDDRRTHEIGQDTKAAALEFAYRKVNRFQTDDRIVIEVLDEPSAYDWSVADRL
ncbi:hypothetical protein [Halococcus saccharolyticus]|uniref:Uncharacterized protein n=1 Tax=Halococcus saccharolyticus DSM 5350 TaxID=1227455 RepID=M0MA76_9EURY|nr:hypothetical protein [Halococcus saccharolyticus]EMA42646.1 hypothetical protein C449_15928 [Halococcus saccharolyticus DSM 5350]